MQTKEHTCIHEATTIVMTELGSTFVYENRGRLKQVHLSSGDREHGILLRDYQPTTLQTLVARGMVSKIEKPVVDVRHRRNAFMAYVNAVALGFLTHHASARLSATTEGSQAGRHWSRHNGPVGDKGAAATQALRRLLSTKKDAVERMRELIGTRVRSNLRAELGGHLNREVIDPHVERLIDEIPVGAWALLLLHHGTGRGGELFDLLAEEVTQMTRQAELADYLALVWVELIAQLQGAHEERGSDSLSVDPTAWLYTDFSGFDSQGATARSRDHHMHMMASTQRADHRALRADVTAYVSDASGRDIGAQTLDRFCRSADAGQTHLGLYYLGFLEDACRRGGVRFRAWGVEAGDAERLNIGLAF